MILEFLNMGGYGLYIWLSYAFAALSLISLYYVSVKKLNSIKNIEHLYQSEKIEDQYSVDKYYLDMYFSEHKIVVECDENNHKDRKPWDERERMDKVNEILGIDDSYWIRYNPDEYDFDVSKVINRIYRKINEIKTEKNTVLVISKADTEIVVPKRTCVVCYKQKFLISDNFKQYLSGYSAKCIECQNNELTNKEKAVVVYNVNGKYIRTFNSIKETAEELKIHKNYVGQVCNGRKNYYKQYIFKFEENANGTEDIEPVYNNIKKPVAKYSKDGKYLETFESATEASKSVGGSKEAIVGACKKSFLSYGFLWRYLTDRDNTEDITGYTYIPNRKYMRHVEIYKDGEL
ncbi:MAG: heme exporter protein CcmD, partial [Proteobacteria bacterium]|nr:heme exporter protein CcmD [Pseudomonadota bacterium]